MVYILYLDQYKLYQINVLQTVKVITVQKPLLYCDNCKELREIHTLNCISTCPNDSVLISKYPPVTSSTKHETNYYTSTLPTCTTTSSTTSILMTTAQYSSSILLLYTVMVLDKPKAGGLQYTGTNIRLYQFQ